MKETMYLFAGIYALLGLVFGSFLNVVICRIPQKESLSFPPSHCTSCDHKLKIIDLIPVFSWIALKGKCRYCQAPISIQYPLIELLCAVMFVLGYHLFGLTLYSLFFCLINLFLFAIAIIDYRHYIIPNKILLCMAPVALIIAYAHTQQPIFLYASSSPWEPLWGALVGSGILFAIALLGFFLYHKMEVMGMGDVKLLIVLGMMLGLTNTLIMLLYAVIIAGVIGFYLIVTKRRKSSEMMALGPYLVISFYLVIIQSGVI